MHGIPLKPYVKTALVFIVSVIVSSELVEWAARLLGVSQWVEKAVAVILALVFFELWSRRHRKSQGREPADGKR